MSRLKRTILGVSGTFVLALSSPAYSAYESGEIIGLTGSVTLEDAISKANRELEKRGKDMASFERDVDTLWIKQLKSQPETLSHYPEVADKLRGKSYWAISFLTSRPYRRGGSYTVFVDKLTGEVLAIIAWE